MSNYQNPPNTDEIMEKLKSAYTIGSVKNLVEDVFPGWFITVLRGFSNDYPHLTKNWQTVCKSMNVGMAQIMIVDDYFEDEAHTLVRHFAECFTRAGFAVRRKAEFIPCEKCMSAIPSEGMYNLMKEKDFNVPEKWSNKCIAC
jgi:hypothetical protein